MEEQDNTKLVMIREYYEPSLAHIDSGVLNAHGIECSLEGENTNSLFRYRRTIVPISLWVREEDAQTSIQLLEQPISDPQETVYQEEPRTGWKLVKYHLTNIWRTLTIT